MATSERKAQRRGEEAQKFHAGHARSCLTETGDSQAAACSWRQPHGGLPFSPCLRHAGRDGADRQANAAASGEMKGMACPAQTERLKKEGRRRSTHGI